MASKILNFNLKKGAIPVNKSKIAVNYYRCPTVKNNIYTKTRKSKFAGLNSQ